MALIHFIAIFIPDSEVLFELAKILLQMPFHLILRENSVVVEETEIQGLNYNDTASVEPIFRLVSFDANLRVLFILPHCPSSKFSH